MAIVDLDSVQFYQPPKHIALLHIDPKHTAAPHHEKGRLGRDKDAVSDDDLPTLEELLCPTLCERISTGDFEDSEYALRTAHQRSPLENSGYANTAQSKPVDLGDSQENPVLVEDDKSDNADIEAASTDSNNGDTGQQLDLCPSLMIYSGLCDDIGGADILDDYYIEDILCSDLVKQDGAMPVRPREPPLYLLSKSLQEPVSQDLSCHTSRNAPRELSYPPLDISDKKRETQHQHQEIEQEEHEEHEEHSHNSSCNDDRDDDHDQDSSDSEGPRPAKRRRLSRSSKDRISKRNCSRRLKHPQDSCSAPVQAQPEYASTRSRYDEVPMSNTRADYREWPMDGFLKRTMFGGKVQYSIEFSLGQLLEPFASTCTQHMSQAGSNRKPSTGSASSSRPPTQAKKTRSGSPSQIKRLRFTEEDDAKLIDMKENKRWSWDKIENEFQGRTRGALQVRYSTKLKHRTSSKKRPRASKKSRRHAA